MTRTSRTKNRPIDSIGPQPTSNTSNERKLPWPEAPEWRVGKTEILAPDVEPLPQGTHARTLAGPHPTSLWLTLHDNGREKEECGDSQLAGELNTTMEGLLSWSAEAAAGVVDSDLVSSSPLTTPGRRAAQMDNNQQAAENEENNSNHLCVMERAPAKHELGGCRSSVDEDRAGAQSSGQSGLGSYIRAPTSIDHLLLTDTIDRELPQVRKVRFVGGRDRLSGICCLAPRTSALGAHILSSCQL